MSAFELTAASTGDVLVIKGLTKTFPGQRALNGIDLTVRAGQIHAVIGQNGSGKSTLVKILSGYHAPDPGGHIWVAGQLLSHGSPADARLLGMRFVHQDLGLVEALSVSDNFRIGTGQRALSLVRRRDELARASRTLRSIGYELDPRSRISELTQSERTGVALARALDDWETSVRLLVIDEATASMPWSESKRLFASLRRIADSGVGVLIISHHLDEVMSSADHVSVLRDGVLVGSTPVAKVNHYGLARLMLGKELIADIAQPGASFEERNDEPAIRVSRLRGDVVQDLSFDVRAGEVIGIAGVTGSGRDEVVGMVGGRLARGGTVRVRNEVVKPGSPGIAMSLGVYTIHADRLRDALLTTGSVRENLTIGGLADVSRFGVLRGRAEVGEATRWVTDIGVYPAETERPILSLSGGNQQKVVLARWLRARPTVLLLDDPTQGVDVGAKVQIHEIIDRAVAEGSAVVVCSTDPNELARLCHKVIVMHRGAVVGTLSGQQISADEIEYRQLNVAREESQGS